MVNAVRLYFRYLGVSVRGQMQYRASFVMLALGNFVVAVTEILCIWVLFARFGSLKGWSLPEVALFYGMINSAFALAEAAGRGFDTFPGLVRSGDFDRLLLRPRRTAFQVSAREVQLIRVGRFSQGLVVLLWAASALDVAWSPARILLLTLAILGGVALFLGLFVIQATFAFWSTETLELMNIVTYGGTEAGQYPLPIYRAWFRKLFIFVVPLACATYFPALAILGRQDALLGSPVWFHWLAPLIGVVFLALSLQVWQFGVRHYRSTGS